jgi:hypothetical protein
MKIAVVIPCYKVSEHIVELISKVGDEVSGIYVIEDVNKQDLIRYKEFFEPKNFLVDYVVMDAPNIPLDNNLVVVRKT